MEEEEPKTRPDTSGERQQLHRLTKLGHIRGRTFWRRTSMLTCPDLAPVASGIRQSRNTSRDSGNVQLICLSIFGTILFGVGWF